MGRFTRQTWSRAGKCRTEGSDKLLPTRRPLDQQLWRIVKLNDLHFFELESLGQFMPKAVRVVMRFLGGGNKVLGSLLQLNFDTVAQSSFSSGQRVAG